MKKELNLMKELKELEKSSLRFAPLGVKANGQSISLYLPLFPFIFFYLHQSKLSTLTPEAQRADNSL